MVKGREKARLFRGPRERPRLQSREGGRQGKKARRPDLLGKARHHTLVVYRERAAKKDAIKVGVSVKDMKKKGMKGVIHPFRGQFISSVVVKTETANREKVRED